MESTSIKINVEEIMGEIRREIEKKGYKNEDISFSDIPVRALHGDTGHIGTFEENLNALRTHWNVVTYRRLKSDRSIGFLIVFIKKVIRKLTKFYIEPIIADQNENNKLAALCIFDLYYDMEAMRRQIKALEKENKQLKQRFDTK